MVNMSNAKMYVFGARGGGGGWVVPENVQIQKIDEVVSF